MQNKYMSHWLSILQHCNVFLFIQIFDNSEQPVQADTEKSTKTEAERDELQYSHHQSLIKKHTKHFLPRLQIPAYGGDLLKHIQD